LSFESFSTSAPAAGVRPTAASAPSREDRPAPPPEVTTPDPKGFDDSTTASPGPRASAAAGLSSDLRFAATTTLDRGITTWFGTGASSQPPWPLSQEPALAFEDQARVVAVAPDGGHFAAGGERGLTSLHTSERPFTEPVILQA